MSGVASLLKKKAGLWKEGGPTSTSLLARQPATSRHLPSQPLKEVRLTEPNGAVVRRRADSVSIEYERLSWVEKENFNLTRDFASDIHGYLKKIEVVNGSSLTGHKISPTHRARMIDWMIEVLTNFKCNDQAFFLAVNLLDRYLKEKRPPR